MVRKIPHRNRSPRGWWIASYMERFAWDDQPKPSLKTKCWVWENTIILKANGRDAAYAKAVKLASGNSHTLTHSKTGKPGRWVYLGLTSLLPIHDKLEDGAEVLWREYEGATFKLISSKVKKKSDLEVFDDSEPD